MAILCSEEQVNVTEGYRYGRGEVYETYCDTPGELFRACQREHGRCVSSVYADSADAASNGGKPRRIGWVFQKQARYEDSGEPFILETWVVLHDALPEKKTTYHYREV